MLRRPRIGLLLDPRDLLQEIIPPLTAFAQVALAICFGYDPVFRRCFYAGIAADAYSCMTFVIMLNIDRNLAYLSAMDNILYNVTVKVDHEIHQEWLKWMKRVHIPAIMETGMFMEYKMCRLLGVDEEDGITYAIQYLSPNMTTYQLYQEKHAYNLQKDHANRYKGKYVAFRTLMKIV
jgi:hypothetical protein